MHTKLRIPLGVCVRNAIGPVDSLTMLCLVNSIAKQWHIIVVLFVREIFVSFPRCPFVQFWIVHEIFVLSSASFSFLSSEYCKYTITWINDEDFLW